MKDLYGYNLKKHNTFGIDVCCRRFMEFCSVDELQNAVNMLTESDKPLLFLGGGSNILFTNDFDGTVLHSAIKGYDVVKIDGGVLLRCGSGEVWDDIVNLCVNNGWHGAENLSHIPGEVGASAIQNIGAYGVEAKDLIFKIEALDVKTGCLREFTNKDCEYSYRWSKFKGEWRNRYIITYVTYKLSDTFTPHLDYGNVRSELAKIGITAPDATQLRNIIIKIRNSKLPDPKIEGNAGSFFMNPIVTKKQFDKLVETYGDVPNYTVDAQHVKIPAGWMIDKCGWKGATYGKAGVHSQQALVLVNRGGADGNDILKLCEAIKKDVKDKFGIDIKPEVNII